MPSLVTVGNAGREDREEPVQRPRSVRRLEVAAERRPEGDELDELEREPHGDPGGAAGDADQPGDHGELERPGRAGVTVVWHVGKRSGRASARSICPQAVARSGGPTRRPWTGAVPRVVIRASRPAGVLRRP
jgi:hypothetical protein